jgi:hypothetical protein
MLGFSPTSDFAVSDIGGDTQGSVSFDAEVTLTASGHTDDPWQCQSADDTTWTCQ